MIGIGIVSQVGKVSRVRCSEGGTVTSNGGVEGWWRRAGGIIKVGTGEEGVLTGRGEAPVKYS